MWVASFGRLMVLDHCRMVINGAVRGGICDARKKIAETRNRDFVVDGILRGCRT